MHFQELKAQNEGLPKPKAWTKGEKVKQENKEERGRFEQGWANCTEQVSRSESVNT